jgi:hypothetical protein
MIDFALPVTFVMGEKEALFSFTPDRSVLTETTCDRGDQNYQFVAKISCSQILAAMDSDGMRGK